MTYTSYDDVDASLIPPDAHHCSYYANGRYANLGAIEKQCPHALLVPILVMPFSGNYKEIVHWEHGLYVDVEATDFTPETGAAEMKKILEAGIYPGAYHSLSGMQDVVNALGAEGLRRDQYGLHSASWNGIPHIDPGMNATQYTNHANGQSLDASLCGEGYFNPHTDPPSSYHGSGTAYFKVQHTGATSDGKFHLDTGRWEMRQPGWSVSGIKPY